MRLDPERVNQGMERRFSAMQGTVDVQPDRQGEITIAGDRFVITGADYLMGNIYELVYNLTGEGAGSIVEHAGKQYGNKLLDLFEFDDDPQIAFGEFLGVLKFFGYSTFTVQPDTVIVHSSPTAVEHQKLGREPKKVCYLLAGILSSAVEPVADAAFSEQTCQANNDNACRFILYDT